MSNNVAMNTERRRSGSHQAQTTAFCPVYHHAVELIGRRWSGAILRVLLSGATRFSDVTGAIPGLSDRLLSERLKELEVEGIVTRTVYPQTPVRIEYALTSKGRALGDVVAAISQWAEEWIEPPAAPPDPEDLVVAAFAPGRDPVAVR